MVTVISLKSGIHEQAAEIYILKISYEEKLHHMSKNDK